MSDQNREPNGDRRDRDRGALSENAAWIGGGLLILLGVIFLLENFGFPVPENWWAVFVLIPGLIAFNTAWSIYRRNNRQVTASARGALVSGLVLTALALALFFNFDFGRYWPVILIALGVAVIAGNFWRRKPSG
jgi:hypothetical protein